MTQKEEREQESKKCNCEDCDCGKYAGKFSKNVYINKRSGGMHSTLGGVYGLAFIGAAIYFIQHSTTFWMGVLGFLKALVWPALLMYRILDILKF